jgi:NAD(P)-dependent dehydrogenase (short-subunit alcohol dehydrogenase family)
VRLVDLDLASDLAVIVGAARGLGAAIAVEFAREAAELVLIDRDAEVMKTAERMREVARSGVRAVITDVTDTSAVNLAAEAALAGSAKPAHVVYAAATGSGKFGFPFWNLKPADWGRVLNVNLIGAANVAHAFGPLLAKKGAGSMLFIASVAGQIGSQTDPPYSASKAGLINFAQCAAKDLAPFGVRVNSICPGMVKTALNQSVYEAWAAGQAGKELPSYEDWADDKIRKLVPLNRWQDPEDIAAMVVFLASARAKNITGQTINVDGGYVMR